ncbi:hypothetical protein NUW58_g10586 [Xylaria curta]|uniref:Uncharacterized protein n=1 Tax=Xylaria curta TaxID=42375 RepID=A0ACC1MIN5_9PEZI|nr:hypothetical protein NUW58_g10586 [Xylaria curta]
MSAKSLLIAALSAVALAAPHVQERQSCAQQWGQCGGNGWSGATCCASGSSCVKQNDYYSQCVPGASTTGATTTTTTSSTTSATRTTTSGVTTTTSAGGGSGTAIPSGNPFSGVQQWANSYYASQVSAYAVPTMGAGAAAVAKVPSFMWMDTRAKVPMMDTTLADIRAANAHSALHSAGIFVLYDLPDRDCAAAASNGELSIADGGVAKYKQYIDSIATILKKYSDIRVILVIGQYKSRDVPLCVRPNILIAQ